MPPSVTAMGTNFSLGLTNESRSTITIDPNATAFYPVGPHWGRNTTSASTADILTARSGSIVVAG